MPYINLNDESLVMLTLAGEQEAYEVLVKRYQRAVIASAVSITHNGFMAEDAAQDAFVTAWMKLDTLNEPAKFASWVCAIAKNCAANMLRRYRSFMPLEDVENYDISGDNSVAELYEKDEEREELRKSVDRLPEKVKTVIHMHYFEGLSIVDIAERMCISEGTVKSQLHDGRKRIRKELCAMNEKWNDTLIEKVMKKVAELKLWQLRSSKDGFEKIYKDVLKDIEELPESDKKNHALADVLMRGWWWLPGAKNDALFARIKQAAEIGYNEDVMEFIMTRELENIPYYDKKARIEFIRDKQIPHLEKAGFRKAQARQYFRLGDLYFEDGKYDEGVAANDKVKSLLKPSDSFYALALNAKWVNDTVSERFKKKDKRRYRVICRSDEFRYIDGELRYWKEDYSSEGYMISYNRDINRLFRAVSFCDGKLFDKSLAIGESYVATDDGTLTFVSDCETVETPAGIFDNCQLWETKHYDRYTGFSTYKAYYKENIGIVKFTALNSDTTETYLLSSHEIKGGNGFLPMHAGNTWNYTIDRDPEYLRSELSCKVIHADDVSVMIASKSVTERLGYDENSWLDMIEEIRNEYHDRNDNDICDVTHAIERAEALATTPMQKAHTKAAASVARRIMETDRKFNPVCTADGYWNFFKKMLVRRKNGVVQLSHDHRWSFEWKNWTDGADALLCNHIYSILEDAGKYFWNDEWKKGADLLVEYLIYDRDNLKNTISCTDGGTVTTKAGTFENCMKITFDISGMAQGLKYRGGNKEYYFAEGIGIIRAVNNLDNLQKAVYELSYYEGVGEGYMPISGGLVRKYEAVGLTDGFYGATEYTYVEDDDGNIVIFADKTGIKNKLAPITNYSTVENEIAEGKLWNEGKLEEARARYGANNIHLICHAVSRNPRSRGDAEYAADIGRFRLGILDIVKENGEIPRGWLGCYCEVNFYMAVYTFGCGRRDEGYMYLERAFEHLEEWTCIPFGEPLDMGNKHMFGGAKYLKGRSGLLLSDGTTEPILDGDILDGSVEMMYNGMKATRGWEWFNSVRGDELFKQYMERAKAIIDKTK